MREFPSGPGFNSRKIKSTVLSSCPRRIRSLALPHSTDGEAFTVNTEQWASFPLLSVKGAYAPQLSYTTADLKAVVAHGRLRGVRVIPEFDVPSHTYPSWDPVGVRAGNSTLLANCSEYPFGFLRVDLDSTYDFLGALLEDVSKAFPDAVYNIGGDEMNAACWNQSAEVARFMEAQQLNGSELTGYFTKKLFRVVQDR